jgi:hypothetical protein
VSDEPFVHRDMSECAAHRERLGKLEVGQQHLLEMWHTTENHIREMVTDLKDALLTKIESLETTINASGPGLMSRVVALERADSERCGEKRAKSALWNHMAPFWPWIGTILFGAACFFFGREIRGK